jgi:thymidylate kinase
MEGSAPSGPARFTTSDIPESALTGAQLAQSSNSAGGDGHRDALAVARIVDAAAADRVLVFGSPPPKGRDVDLLAREPEERALASKLAREGFEQRGLQWARFRDCTVVAVDLVAAAEWHLPADELAALFEEAVPLSEFEHLVVPAPHHALLIAARRVSRSGAYAERLRSRVGEIGSRTPSAWEEARQRAPAWGAERSLARLRALHNSGAWPAAAARLRAFGERATTTTAPRRGARRALRRLTGRPAIVALSGLDGAGKSFQAARLADQLEQLGLDAAVVWPAATNLLYQASPALKRVLRRMLAALGRSPKPTGRGDSASGASKREEAVGDAAEEPWPRQVAPVAHALALVVAVVQAWSFRRGATRSARGAQVVIYDRYTLDSVVYLRHRWGHGRTLRLQSLIIRRLSRTPDLAFLLEVAPEVAYERKQDFPLDNLRERARLYRELYAHLGVIRLDGERPRDELCAVIAREVWRRVG